MLLCEGCRLCLEVALLIPRYGLYSADVEKLHRLRIHCKLERVSTVEKQSVHDFEYHPPKLYAKTESRQVHSLLHALEVEEKSVSSMIGSLDLWNKVRMDFYLIELV